MRKITIALPDGLYAELQEVSAATNEFGYGPEHWACDVVASELAARRLPKVVLGSLGARICRDVEPEPQPQPQGHRVVRPEKRRIYA